LGVLARCQVFDPPHQLKYIILHFTLLVNTIGYIKWKRECNGAQKAPLHNKNNQNLDLTTKN
jgi:hypothetical protein